MVVIATLILNIFINFIYVRLGKRFFKAVDVFKIKSGEVTDLGGIAILISLLLTESILFLFGFIGLEIWISITSISIIASLVGFIDDMYRGLPGWYKPFSALLIGLPVLFLRLYDDKLTFYNGYTFNLPVIYPILILIGFSVATNAVNMLDVINGSATIGVLIIFIGNAIYLAYRGINTTLHISVISVLTSFLIFNIYPSRVFLGNIGSILIGSLLAYQAVVYETEFLTVISMYPFIVNGLFYLERFRRFIERRVHGYSIVSLNEAGLIQDDCEEGAPIVLLKYLVAPGPKSEKTLLAEITLLFIFSTLSGLVILLYMG